MPRLPIDYAKTIIYKIVCNDLNITECYVGHTTDFVCRKQGHKNRCINENGKKYNLKLYRIIRDNGGWVNYSMIEIEKYPCNDVNEAKKKEREWFEIINSKLNTYSPQRRQNTLEEYKKQWAEDNRDRIIEHKKQNYESNKEELLLKQKQYRESHKEIIRERKRKTYSCDCGKITTIDNKGQHLRTKFHMQFITGILTVSQ
jgi:hypothetical protein